MRDDLHDAMMAQIRNLEADNDRLRIALTDAGSYLEKGLDKMAFNIILAAQKGDSND